MAEALLKAWGASPIVSAVEIDAASKQVARAENTTVTGLTVAGPFRGRRRMRRCPCW